MAKIHDSKSKVLKDAISGKRIIDMGLLDFFSQLLFKPKVDLQKLAKLYRDVEMTNVQFAQQIGLIIYTSLLTIILAELAFTAAIGLVSDKPNGAVGVWVTSMLVIAFAVLLIDLFLISINVNRSIRKYKELQQSLQTDIEVTGKLKIALSDLGDKYHPKNMEVKKIRIAGKLCLVSLLLVLISSVLLIVRVAHG